MSPRPARKQKEVTKKYDFTALYSLKEAIDLVKESARTKFDASIDIAFHLGIDPKKADQMVRGVVILPHGTGKVPRVLAICTPDKEQEAKDAGADHVGLEDYINKISAGWTDIDTIVTMPSLMAKLGRLGKIIGPKGLMPNPKSGTVTLDIGKAVKEIKAGKVSIKTDKYGILHTSVGRLSFEVNQIKENITELFEMLIRLKPSTAKGVYIKSITLSSTMGKGVRINKEKVLNR